MATTGIFYLQKNDIYDMYNGWMERLLSSNFLFQMSKEQDAEYNARLLRTVYNNWLKKAVNIYIGYMFWNMKVEETDPSFDIRVVAYRNGLDALVGGCCYILTSGEGATVLTVLQVAEEKPERYFIVKLENVEEIHIDLDAGTIMQGGKTETLKPGQFVKVKWNKKDLSLLHEAAYTARKIFNLESLKDYKAYKLGYEYYYGPRASQDELPMFGGYLKVPEGLAPPGVLPMSDVESINTLKKEIADSIMDLGSSVGLSSEFSSIIKVESGLAKVIDAIDIAATIRVIAMNISRAVNQAAEFYASLTSTEPSRITLDGEIKPDASASDLENIATVLGFVDRFQGLESTPRALLQKAVRIISDDAFDMETKKRMMDEIDKAMIRKPETTIYGSEFSGIIPDEIGDDQQ